MTAYCLNITFLFGWVVSVQRITNWQHAVMMEQSEFGTFFGVMKNEFSGVYIILYFLLLYYICSLTLEKNILIYILFIN